MISKNFTFPDDDDDGDDKDRGRRDLLDKSKSCDLN